MFETVSIKDNTHQKELFLSDNQWKDLSLIAGRSVKSLCNRDETGMSLLVFPHSLDAYGDKISDSTIIDIQDSAISSGNLMGFIGCRNTKLRIYSRFDSEQNDYFMHYMLEKVFSVNMFDLKYSTDAESVFDFVIFIFPFFLRKALSQGLYKEYVTRHHNDDRARGVVDITKHIRLNFPFSGKVAYKTREHSADNDLMELIRHTIEYIRSKEFGSGVLSRDEETKANVSLIVDATPNYEKSERGRIISKNLRAKVHPYYSEYEPLRKLCIQILRQEEIKYGKDDDTVYGVLFDGAWLWEEYLYTIIEKSGFKHPENKLGRGAIHLFSPKRGPRYPDFYNETTVLDAKYKRYSGGGITDISREDLAQVISYMFIKKLSVGGFLVPGGESVKTNNETLNGYGGKMYLLNLPIAIGAPSYSSFRDQMAQNEKSFLDSIETFAKIPSAAI